MIPPNLASPEPLSADHVLDDFACGEASLDDWLKKRALKNQASGASRCFVLCQNNAVIGYYSLSAGGIHHEGAPKPMRRNMPDPLPILLLGRLAIDRRHHNQGLGRALLRDAMLRAVRVAADAGIFAILVHALSEQAKRFYLSRGFVESPLQPMTLLMTLATVRSILAEPD
ncbi:MAG: GNAT family N-acetyltransferase [Candidatus Binataceae bacterium]